jgi:hypothetical protein
LALLGKNGEMVYVSTWEDRKPILITGSHRSGSTWLASMLSLSKNSLMAHEPFNIQSWAYALDGLAKYWFTYAPALPQDAALEAYSKVIEQRTRKIFLKNQLQHWIPPLRHQRLIVKDPIAALSSDWIAKNFDHHADAEAPATVPSRDRKQAARYRRTGGDCLEVPV